MSSLDTRTPLAAGATMLTLGMGAMLFLTKLVGLLYEVGLLSTASLGCALPIESPEAPTSGLVFCLPKFWFVLYLSV